MPTDPLPCLLERQAACAGSQVREDLINRQLLEV
jgi:hypothetical protein